MVNPAIEGFMEPWVWNQELATIQYVNLYFCILIGSWGLFIYNDNGEMMDRCFKESGGLVMEYETLPENKDKAAASS